MTSLLQTGLNAHLPAPPEKRFLISSVRELQHRLKAILDNVDKGETYEIRRHNREIATSLACERFITADQRQASLAEDAWLSVYRLAPDR